MEQKTPDLPSNITKKSARLAGRYMKYALGEIILVVVGILIALGINNWNQNRVNSNKEQGYLVGFKNDLEKQIASLITVNLNYDLIISKGESILEDFTAIGQIVKIDSLNNKLSYLMYTGKYPEISTTFNELNSTGQLNLIGKKALRSLIIEYYQNSNTYQRWVDGNTDKVLYDQVFPIIKSTVIISPENFGFENKNIRLESKLKTTFEKNLSNADQEFELVNAISLCIIVAKTNQKQINSSKQEAEFLLNKINSELNEFR